MSGTRAFQHSSSRTLLAGLLLCTPMGGALAQAVPAPASADSAAPAIQLPAVPTAEAGSSPSATAAPAPVPVVLPLPAPAAKVRPAARPAAAKPEQAPKPAPVARREPAPVNAPVLVPSPVASEAPTALPEASASPETESPALATPEPAPRSDADWLPWAGGIAAVLALGGLVLGLSRRRVRGEAAPDSPPAPAAKPEPAPAPAPPPAPTPPPAAKAPEAAPVAQGLSLALLADRFTATLANATLAARIVLTNHGRDALVDLALSGDMASAHASRPMDEQLGLAGPELPPLAQIARIEAGASVTVPVEMRLPLAAVLAIRAGEAQLFVPIARAACWATHEDTGSAEHAHGAFLIGQPSDTPGARLAPFRLDQGPRVFDQVDQRVLPLPEAPFPKPMP